jgi:hypothetical protein
MPTVMQIIDTTIKNISGRELVSSSEMIDLLLDLRSHTELQKLAEDNLKVVCAPLQSATSISA